jgi:hypothetical protein
MDARLPPHCSRAAAALTAIDVVEAGSMSVSWPGTADSIVSLPTGCKT